MSKVTISFEGSVKSVAEVIPAMAKLLAPAPLNFCIEEGSEQPKAKRAPYSSKLSIPEPEAAAEKKAQAKREATKRHAEKKAAEKDTDVAVNEEAPAEKPARTSKPAKPAKPGEEAEKITMTTLRAAAGKLAKTKLVPVLEELGVTKLSELTEDNFEKALAAFEAANG